jgi:hypothetical protein
MLPAPHMVFIKLWPGNFNGKRPKDWGEGIKMDLQKTGLKVEDYTEQTKGRRQWCPLDSVKLWY